MRAATVIRWLGQIMMNFTVGLISALFTFMFSLISMLWEYKVRVGKATLRTRLRGLPIPTRSVATLSRHPWPLGYLGTGLLPLRHPLLRCRHDRRLSNGRHFHRRHVRDRGGRSLHGDTGQQ